LRQHSEDNEYVKKRKSWLKDTLNDEVHGVLKWVMKDYNDASMELVKERMIVKNDRKT